MRIFSVYTQLMGAAALPGGSVPLRQLPHSGGNSPCPDGQAMLHA